MVRFNWVGICVSDLEKSRSFYEDALDFRLHRLPRESGDPEWVQRALRLPMPLGLESCFLSRDGLVLSMMCFTGSGVSIPRTGPRRFDQFGLAHISLTVDDMDEVCAAVEALGGTVLSDTRTTTDTIGELVHVCDPDGQIIELVTPGYFEFINRLMTTG